MNAVKLDRVFAKPFIGALSGHSDGVWCTCTNPKSLVGSVFPPLIHRYSLFLVLVMEKYEFGIYHRKRLYSMFKLILVLFVV